MGVDLKMHFGVAMAATTVTFAAFGATYRFACDHADARYRLGEPAKITVSVIEKDSSLVKTGGCSVCLNNCFGRVVKGGRSVDLARENPFTVTGTLNEPGFLGVSIAGKGVVWSVGFEPEKIRTGAPRPDDFDAFWRTAIENLDRTTPPDLCLEKDEKASTPAAVAYRISFATAGGTRVYGFYTAPTDRAKGPYPAFVNVPGAGLGVSGRPRAWTDRVTLTMNVHRFEPQPDAKAQGVAYAAQQKALNGQYGFAKGYNCDKYWMMGASASREDYFYYAAILGINRAVRWLAERPEVDRTKILYSGTSQGGAFGCYLAGLNPGLFRRSVIVVPALCDHLGGRAGRRAGWPQLLAGVVDPKKAETIAPYFDAAHFAARIANPVRFRVGLADIMCPPASVYAAFNAVPVADKRITDMIGCGHGDGPAEFSKADAAWLTEGVFPKK